MPRVALATSAAFPELYDDDQPLLAALRSRDVVAEPVVWDDPAADWAAYDLTVIRSTWDYHERRDDFVRWARSVPRLVNPAEVVAWNTDKVYLRDLAAAGVPVVPTAWVTTDSLASVMAENGWTDVVVKPTVSAGARNTLRVQDPADGEALLRTITAEGVAMVQPYLDSVEGYGERSLLFCDGALTHAVRRNPALALEGESRYDARAVDAERSEVEVARAVLDATAGLVPGADPLLYARVDLVRGPRDEVLLIELEVTEPQLFLRYGGAAADRLADAILARAGQ